MKYLFAVLLLFVLIALFTNTSSSGVVEEPFTPYLRQQYRQRARAFRLGIKERQKKAMGWFNGIVGRYGLGF